MPKPSPIPLMLAAGLVLAVSSGKKAPPKLGGPPAPRPGSEGVPASAPKAPAIPDSAGCSFFLELHDANGNVVVGGDEAVFVQDGPKGNAKEAEGAARERDLDNLGPPGSRWVLVGVCDIGGELIRYQAAVIKTFAEDE